jgi:hypothetical protein
VKRGALIPVVLTLVVLAIVIGALTSMRRPNLAINRASEKNSAEDLHKALGANDSSLSEVKAVPVSEVKALSQSYTGYSHVNGQTYTPPITFSAGDTLTCVSGRADKGIPGCYVTSGCCNRLLTVGGASSSFVAPTPGQGYLFCQGQAELDCTLSIGSSGSPWPFPWPKPGEPGPNNTPPIDVVQVACYTMWHQGVDVFEANGETIVSAQELKHRMGVALKDKEQDNTRAAMNAEPDDLLRLDTQAALKLCKNSQCGVDFGVLTTTPQHEGGMSWACYHQHAWWDMFRSLQDGHYPDARKAFYTAQSDSVNVKNLLSCLTATELQELFVKECKDQRNEGPQNNTVDPQKLGEQEKVPLAGKPLASR